MQTLSRAFVAACVLALAPVASAKGHAHAADSRAVGDLAGKYKWNMSQEMVIKIIADNMHQKYVELIKKEPDVYKQDLLRKEEGEKVQKVRDSYVKFDADNPRAKEWSTSIIQSEFAPRNDESLLTLWEPNQRRFLFFWHDKLYKQYIAFDAKHPAFEGKSFDEFAKVIQNRYGPAEMKFSPLRTRQEMKLDHLEWPAAGDYQLYAIDQSEFYGNFCLVLFQPHVAKEVERARSEHNTKPARGNPLIDAVTTPEKQGTDVNENVVDQITGKAPQKKN